MTRRIIAIVLSLAAALAALFFGRMFIEGQRVEVPVAVAAHDISAFTRIERDMLKPLNVPRDAVLPGMVVNPADVVGELAGRDIEAGEPVLNRDLKNQVSGRDFLSLLENQQRGMAVPVTLDAAFGGELRAGDYVDLIWVTEWGATRVLSNAKLLGLRAGNASNPEATGETATPSVALLAVLPEEAEQLAYMQWDGEFILLFTPEGAAITDQEDTSPNADPVEEQDDELPDEDDGPGGKD